MYGYPTVTANNWLYGVQYKYYSITDTATFKMTSPSSEITSDVVSNLQTAETAYNDVLDSAGAILPLRDAHDKRIVGEVENGTATGYGTISSYTNNGSTFSNTTFFGVVKGIIDDPVVVGGWPVFSTGTVPADTDGDGMSDAWETSKGLNPADSTDGNSIAASGYTNLEEYLNSIGTFQNFLQSPFNLKASLNVSNKPVLSWQDVSDSEENYVIERSVNDTTNFTAIDTIAANSSSYTDSTANGANYIYRVRAITSSLRSLPSDTVLISVPTGVRENKMVDLLVFPNPVVNEVTVQTESGIANLELYAVNGTLLQSFSPCSTKITIPMSSYQKGIYTLKVVAFDGREQSLKLIKN
jgi:hypothetical protein